MSEEEKRAKASRWNGGRARYTEEMIEDDRWVSKGGRKIRVQDDVSESTYLERRKSPPGFHRGARVGRR